jgi:hypothetical protein
MLDFGADDTGELIIDGVAAVNFATGVGNTYSTCSDFMPGCDSATEVLNMNVTSFFSPGVNTVQIVDQQINGESYGVDATITAVTAAPEPATFSLIGCGLLAIGLGNKRKLFRRT